MPAQSVLASLSQAPVSCADAEYGSNNMAVRKRELVVAIRMVILASCLRVKAFQRNVGRLGRWALPGGYTGTLRLDGGPSEMGRGRRSYTLRGSPTKNWSKLLTCRSFSGAILCDTEFCAKPRSTMRY